MDLVLTDTECLCKDCRQTPPSGGEPYIFKSGCRLRLGLRFGTDLLLTGTECLCKNTESASVVSL